MLGIAVKLGTQIAGLVGVLMVSALGWGQDSAKETEPPELRKELAGFSSFIGTWEIDGKWLSGEAIWARTVYSVGMSGNYVEARTYTRNADGEVYQRYMTIWRWDAEKAKIISHGFVYDGSYLSIGTDASMEDGKSTLRSEWEQSGTHIKQQVQIIDANQYSWKVSALQDETETPLMDGVWVRK